MAAACSPITTFPIWCVTPSSDLRTADGRHIRVHCLKLENGGRLLTYHEVSDLVRHAEQRSANRRRTAYSRSLPEAREWRPPAHLSRRFRSGASRRAAICEPQTDGIFAFIA